jgi:hypothetical protein
MQLLGVLGFASFTLMSFGVGIRMLRLGSRTRQLPELTMGGSLALSGGVGGALLLLARAGGGAGGDALFAASSYAMAIGAALLALFTWRVFRPSERRAAALFAGLLAALVASQLGRWLVADFDPDHPGPFTWLGLAARIAVYAWACGEAFREHAAARRRCALGLGDALVANRLLLWGVALGAVVLIWVNSAAQMARGNGRDPLWLLIAVLGLICASSLWLAFFPPASYRRRFAPAGGPDRLAPSRA